jgi:hypothetical protein
MTNDYEIIADYYETMIDDYEAATDHYEITTDSHQQGFQKNCLNLKSGHFVAESLVLPGCFSPLSKKSIPV